MRKVFEKSREEEFTAHSIKNSSKKVDINIHEIIYQYFSGVFDPKNYDFVDNSDIYEGIVKGARINGIGRDIHYFRNYIQDGLFPDTYEDFLWKYKSRIKANNVAYNYNNYFWEVSSWGKSQYHRYDFDSNGNGIIDDHEKGYHNIKLVSKNKMFEVVYNTYGYSDVNNNPAKSGYDPENYFHYYRKNNQLPIHNLHDKEIIESKRGNLNLLLTQHNDGVNMGTFNYVLEQEGWIDYNISHFIYDIRPWCYWGNTAESREILDKIANKGIACF